MLIAILVISVLNTIFNVLFLAAFLWGVFSSSKQNLNEEKRSESEKQQKSPARGGEEK